MGRAGGKTSSHQQQQDQVVDGQDLYGPPPADDDSPKKNNQKQHPPPQKWPPAAQDEEFATTAFPPPSPPGHEYHDDPMMKTQAFPPLPDDDDLMNKTQAFPPPQDYHTAQPFPPPPPNPNHGITFGHPVFPPQPQILPPKPSPVQVQLPTQSEPWKTHIFDCMSNPQNAIITLFFPCVTFGQIAEILDSGRTSCGSSGKRYATIACCFAMPCLLSCGYRSKLRAKFGLVESPAPDWLVHLFCEPLALCQEYRELQLRGIDPSIGWSGNVAKLQQQQLAAMTPPMQQRML